MIMSIIKGYLNPGRINKMVVSLTNNTSARPYLHDLADTGLGAHILVDENGVIHRLIEDPENQACVPRQLLDQTSIHSPALWVDFVGTCIDDMTNMDLPAVLTALCEEYDIQLISYPEARLLSGRTFVKAHGIVQRSRVRGYENATDLPIPTDFMYTRSLSSDTITGDEPIPASPAQINKYGWSHRAEEALAAPGPPLSEDWPAFTGRSLQLGSQGNKILILATAYEIDTSVYNSELEEVVLAAQEAAGLETNGVIDAATWEALNPYN
jgi:hypothetical protein